VSEKQFANVLSKLRIKNYELRIMKKIKIKINGQSIVCKEGDPLGKVAHENDIYIPKLCFHKDFPIKGNCRVCVVEIKGQNKLVPSCTTKTWDGMDVLTESPKVQKLRNLNIELIFAEHIEKCANCVWRLNCPLLFMADKYGIKINRFRDRKSKRKIWKFSNAVEIDGTQCIDCGNCIDACSLMQDINYLKFAGKGHKQEVVPRDKEGFKCILCGQCALHCPVSSAQEQTNWEETEKDLTASKRKKILVAQFAPSIRVSIGEEFGLPYGKVVTGKVVAGLRALGFNYVFDVNFGADTTTVVEAKELLERLKAKKGLPMMTSCCPGWVNYVELYHPELIPNLTTARSPHIHLGGIIKTYFAKNAMINPKDIKVVSIMPCTAKKYEAQREEMKIDGNYPVDRVITTREFAWLMKKRANIDFVNLKSSKADNPLGEYTGAAAIYGGSGGVMESALRTAHALACGSKKSGICKSKIDFKKVRGLEGVKEAVVEVAGKKLRIAVVNGIGNFKHIKNNLKNYDYIEVMACPGGCIGGGGQPIPTNDEIRKKRVEALYEIDKKLKVRKAHENKGVEKALDWIHKEKLDHKTLHTSYKKRT